ncbi:MAG: hypothetical protein BGO03_04865 [Mesorhizobium sp. 61-13]|nr:MAG: hypothetical protein BGO03_04865 [Mesorhizobium sp. 61-13]
MGPDSLVGELPECGLIAGAETTMDDILDQLAEVRGEALAGRILATIALDYALRTIKHKDIAFDYFLMQIDRDLKEIQFSDGDQTLHDKVRGIARNHANQAIERLRAACSGK